MAEFERDSKKYYEVLGVAIDVDAEGLKLAYRVAVKKYHPDVNKSAAAHEVFVRLRNAYDVLGDEKARADYDKSHKPPPEPPPRSSPRPKANTRSRPSPRQREEPHAGQEVREKKGRNRESNFTPETRYYEVDEPEMAFDFDAEAAEARQSQGEVHLVVCSETGEVTAQPRAIRYWVVVSFLLMTWRKPVYGVYSRRGADKAALRASLTTWLLGWWGILGPFYTIRALITNLMGGEMPRDENAILLGEQGVAFKMLGKLDLARSTLDSAITFAIDRNIKRELIRYRQKLGPMRKRLALKASWALMESKAFWIQLVPLLAVFALITYVVLTLFFPQKMDVFRDRLRQAPIIRAAERVSEVIAPIIHQGQGDISVEENRDPLITEMPVKLPLYAPPEIMPVEPLYNRGDAFYVPVPNNRTARLFLYSGPDENTPQIRELTPFTSLILDAPPANNGWVRVSSLNGDVSGYVPFLAIMAGSGIEAYGAFCAVGAGNVLTNGEVLYRLSGVLGSNRLTIQNDYDKEMIVTLRNRIGQAIYRFVVLPENNVTKLDIPNGRYNLSYAVGRSYSRECGHFIYEMQPYQMHESLNLGAESSGILGARTSYNYAFGGDVSQNGVEEEREGTIFGLGHGNATRPDVSLMSLDSFLRE